MKTALRGADWGDRPVDTTMMAAWLRAKKASARVLRRPDQAVSLPSVVRLPVKDTACARNITEIATRAVPLERAIPDKDAAIRPCGTPNDQNPAQERE
jgi:hypothetical protein